MGSHFRGILVVRFKTQIQGLNKLENGNTVVCVVYPLFVVICQTLSCHDKV